MINPHYEQKPVIFTGTVLKLNSAAPTARRILTTAKGITIESTSLTFIEQRYAIRTVFSHQDGLFSGLVIVD
jgi:hypothetical protein